jgi:glutamine amidotransferase PdxT
VGAGASRAGKITAAIRCWWRKGRHLAATFHPELTADPRVHRYFLERL